MVSKIIIKSIFKCIAFKVNCELFLKYFCTKIFSEKEKQIKEIIQTNGYDNIFVLLPVMFTSYCYYHFYNKHLVAWAPSPLPPRRNPHYNRTIFPELQDPGLNFRAWAEQNTSIQYQRRADEYQREIAEQYKLRNYYAHIPSKCKQIDEYIAVLKNRNNTLADYYLIKVNNHIYPEYILEVHKYTLRPCEEQAYLSCCKELCNTPTKYQRRNPNFFKELADKQDANPGLYFTNPDHMYWKLHPEIKYYIPAKPSIPATEKRMPKKLPSMFASGEFDSIPSFLSSLPSFISSTGFLLVPIMLVILVIEKYLSNKKK